MSKEEKNYIIFPSNFFFLSFLFLPLLPFVLDWIGVKLFFCFFFSFGAKTFFLVFGKKRLSFMLFLTLSSAPNRTAQHTTNTIKRRALLTNLPAGAFPNFFFSFLCQLCRESRGTLLLHEKINAWEIRNLLALRYNLDKGGSRGSNERRSLFGLITRPYFLSFLLSCEADKEVYSSSFSPSTSIASTRESICNEKCLSA